MRQNLCIGLLLFALAAHAQVRSFAPPPPNIPPEVLIDSSIRRHEHETKLRALEERMLFEQRYNRLLQAVREFADAYNKAEGIVWPQKKASDVEKAYRNLTKTSSWKRTPALTGADAEPDPASTNEPRIPFR